MKSNLMVLALAALMVVPALAQDETQAKKKGKGQKATAQSATAQLLKQLAPVSLTAEQTAKIKEMGKKNEEAIKQLQTEAGLTDELLKKRRELADSEEVKEQKGKQRVAAVNAAAGLNEAQSAAVVKANELRAKFKAEVVKLLTPEQKEKLPKAFTAGPGKKAGADGDAKKPGGKKKAAEAE